MTHITHRPIAALMAALLLLLFASPAVAEYQGFRIPIHDPKQNKPGSLLQRAENIRAHENNDQPADVLALLDKLRLRLDELDRDGGGNPGADFIAAWDTLTSVELQVATHKFLSQQGERLADSLQQVLVQRFPDGTTEAVHTRLAWLYSGEIFRRSDAKLRAIEARLDLPSQVELRGKGECDLAEGVFDVALRDHLVELSADGYAAYFGATSDRELWLHINETRWAVTLLDDLTKIRAPYWPGRAFVLTPTLTPEGQGFAGSQWQNPNCRVEIRPVAE